MRTRKSMSKKSRSCESNDGMEDRLTGLPDEVIVHILSFMPTLDAVRTMVLRRFRNLWTLVPALGFSFDFYRRWPDDKQSSTHEAFSRFACFVRTVLILHRRSTIDTFRLSISNYHDELEGAKIIGDVQTWLRFATEREVKDLYFHYDTLGYLGPPCCIFTSQYLTTLTLSGCMLEHYEHGPQPHMGTLRKVSLIQVSGSNEAFNQLISGCPSLQELVIDNAFFGQGIESLNINAPSVSKLNLCLNLLNFPCTLNCPGVKILDIGVNGVSETSEDFQLTAIDLSSLQEVNLECLPRSCSSRLLMVVVKALFKLIENAEVFTLSFTAFERISSIEKLEFPQNRWKRIVLYTWPWCSSERCGCLEVIFKLIRSSVKMEELTIYAEYLGKGVLLCSELSTCVMPLLKTVTVHGYYGYKEWCKGKLQLIEFLLKNAVVLDKLVISLGKSKLTTVEELDLVKQVSTFRRASANATVIFASS